jgi:glycosyltransferase involved in cell wall biosynthesis
MLLSIITINYNNLEGLRKTMPSVIEQTYKNIEYIVIDGGSTDGSKAYIERYLQDLAYFVSEPDQGIYDAMNKGIDHANGDYLLFLNSGDYFVSVKVLSEFIAKQPTEQIVYGNIQKIINDKIEVFEMPEIDTLVSGLRNSLIHQAVFFSRSLFVDNNRYDTSYKIVADWVFINNALSQKCTIKHIDLVVVYFDTDGISSDRVLRLNERKRYLEETFDEDFLILLNEHENLKRDFSYLKRQFFVKTYLKYLAFKKKSKHFFTSN